MGLSEDAARLVLEHAESGPARLGSTRLVCVDGPSGSGKTSLAAAVVRLRPHATVLHTDDMLAGWDGLGGLADSLASALEPLREDRPGRWRRWDWTASRWAGWHPLAPTALLLVEGVGSLAPGIDDVVTTRVWVEAPRTVRLERAVARDGEAIRTALTRWVVAEDALHADRATRAGADVVVEHP